MKVGDIVRGNSGNYLMTGRGMSRGIITEILEVDPEVSEINNVHTGDFVMVRPLEYEGLSEREQRGMKFVFGFDPGKGFKVEDTPYKNLITSKDGYCVKSQDLTVINEEYKGKGFK